MRIIENPAKERALIESIIKKYGYTPDHNFDWLMYCADESDPRVVIWENECAVWCYRNQKKNEWRIISDPIASPNSHPQLLNDLVRYIFDSRANKVLFLDVRDNVRDFLKTSDFGGYEFDYDTVWPVVDMSLFNPEISGGRFKEIRNALNKFNREHQAKVIPTNLIDKKDLHGVVDRWFDNRTKAGIEELYPNRYHNMINGDFRGTKSARVMLVDGKAVGFNAGWETPNNPSEWSATIGLHDFSVKDLGIVLLIEDLKWIKKAGYKTTDLEATDKQALKFKKQFFLPDTYSTYKTYTFCIDQV